MSLQNGISLTCANERCGRAFVIGDRQDGKPDRRSRFCCAECERQHWRDVTRHPRKAGTGTPMTNWHSAREYAAYEKKTSNE